MWLGSPKRGALIGWVSSIGNRFDYTGRLQAVDGDILGQLDREKKRGLSSNTRKHPINVLIKQ